MKLSANLELFDNDLLEGYARLCGWIMARAHAKASGQAIEVSAYIGRGDQFAEALTGYATSYADQVERDYGVFLKACRSGELEVRTDEDMAADFGR
jgi:3-methyladenine DNA glycosylase Mpg